MRSQEIKSAGFPVWQLREAFPVWQLVKGPTSSTKAGASPPTTSLRPGSNVVAGGEQPSMHPRDPSLPSPTISPRGVASPSASPSAHRPAPALSVDLGDPQDLPPVRLDLAGASPRAQPLVEAPPADAAQPFFQFPWHWGQSDPEPHDT